jgi:hypothetical protein
VVGYRQTAQRVCGVGVSVAWYSERSRRLYAEMVVVLEVGAAEVVKRGVSDDVSQVKGGVKGKARRLGSESLGRGFRMRVGCEWNAGTTKTNFDLWRGVVSFELDLPARVCGLCYHGQRVHCACARIIMCVCVYIYS